MTQRTTSNGEEVASGFSRRRRAQIRFASWVGYWAIALVGRTLRWESSGLEHLEAIYRSGQRAIFTFWHGSIFPATWYWRGREIVVMTSLNFDGEIIARCIRRHGYGAARGSSSRAGFRAMAELARSLRSGRDVAFTIDGPRGPRFVAKQGPLILARKTGAAVFCFQIALKRKIQLDSWDLFQIPIPFTRARLLAAAPIWVPEDADVDLVKHCHRRMQETLDELQAAGRAWERE